MPSVSLFAHSLYTNGLKERPPFMYPTQLHDLLRSGATASEVASALEDDNVAKSLLHERDRVCPRYYSPHSYPNYTYRQYSGSIFSSCQVGTLLSSILTKDSAHFQRGFSPLHASVASGRADLVEVLIANKAPADARDDVRTCHRLRNCLSAVILLSLV